MKFYYYSLAVIAITLTALVSCEKIAKPEDEIGILSEYRPLSEGDLYSNLNPEQSWDFYQIRHFWCGEDDFVTRYTRGETQKDLAEINPETGFHISCLPACCAEYVVAVKGEEVQVFNTSEKLLTFLGTLNTEGEALLYVYSLGYDLPVKNELTGAIRKTTEGYQVVCLKLVNDCDPVKTDRFVLNVFRDGTISVINRENFSTEEGCI